MPPVLNSPHKGACHCGSIQFETTLVGGDLSTARRCSCSICRMRGAVAVSTLLEDFRITSGEDKLTLYQFNTKSAKHYFCSACGIYTHHQRRSNPDHYGINLACLEGFTPFDIEEVVVWDGTRHPQDTGGKVWPAGILHFEKSSQDTPTDFKG